MVIDYHPGKRDWTEKEANEYFTFRTGLTTTDPNAIYYGELITLYNPNIKRATIDDIPLRSMLAPDLTLLANPYQIKQIKPPED